MYDTCTGAGCKAKISFLAPCTHKNEFQMQYLDVPEHIFHRKIQLVTHLRVPIKVD